MPKFSARSLNNLGMCHPLLQQVAHEAIKYYDFTVTEATRGREDQEKAKAGGFSNAAFGQSAHNYSPALAFDAYSYPIDVNDVARAKVLGLVMLGAASIVGVKLTWGGTWKSIKDYPHFELTDWKTLRNVS